MGHLRAHIVLTISTIRLHRAYVGCCGRVLRMLVRMSAWRSRIRIARSRVRIRLSVRGLAFMGACAPAFNGKNSIKKFGAACAVRGLLRSGNANNGSNVSLAYANTNNTVSDTNTNIGSQFSLKN